ncbi:hypothetical protein L8R84_22815 [Vibrio splendidus]|uniref:hypothetical protein n=1 Tax=Vibrio splendidus TaxID=29497 RepID=UPI002469B622|nr:hypothetical protein [Vibrio splendidus]MDH5938942.1 hypothetical protein [Vibrio splendidus]
MNPFNNFKMKHLPDAVLVVSGIIFVGTFMAMLKEANLPHSTLGWVLLTGGFFSFCIGWKNAHYRAIDKGTKKWADFWRNNTLTNIFLGVAIGLTTGGLACLKLGSL